VSSAGRRLWVDAGRLNREVVLENDAVVGSVNANLHHCRLAAGALAGADYDWLQRLITRRLPLEQAADAFEASEQDVKVVIALSEDA
jgi:glucose 1-dehydrogenase